jgi:hypothetical protein
VHKVQQVHKELLEEEEVLQEHKEQQVRKVLLAL